MYDYCRKSRPRFLIGTEAGILYRLRTENPDKEFILASPPLLSQHETHFAGGHSPGLQTMERWCSLGGDRVPAKRALDRMLAIPRD